MNYKKILILILLLLPVTVLAQPQYQPLVGVPGVSADTGINLNTYINALYALSITVAALLAVIKIIIAGVKWMLSDVVTSKQEAKSDIWGATLGLLIVISAVLIFTQINPQITETNFLVPKTNVPFKNNDMTGVTQMPKPEGLPAGTAFWPMENNADNEKICEFQHGGTWYTDDSSEVVWCAKAPKEILKKDIVGCVNHPSDCSNVANDCKNMGAVDPYYEEIMAPTGEPFTWKFKCIY